MRLAEERVVVVGAVDDQAVERAALAGEADVAGADVARHARRQQREVDEVAAVDRQVLHRGLGDRRADLRAGRLDDRRAAGDVDGLGDARRPPSGCAASRVCPIVSVDLGQSCAGRSRRSSAVRS